MVRMCAFPGCFNRQKAVRLRPRPLSPEERLTFHRFPLNDPQRLRLWLLAVQRDTGLPVQSLDVLRLCSLHFSRDDFRSDKGNVRRYLKSTAVPVWFLKTEEAEDEETVAAVSEKSVKTGGKYTTPALPQIKLESRSAALGNVPVEEEAKAQSNGMKK
ncbi:THAP domain-containing protein 4-like isoform X4 [Sinocyclocheilus anshuiensis]|uniref:THAP domain-containing protein 4-like isoform X4 n=1 Tax=Sinocyclocheilus anshuiensis TaxID=1608454 RepID=UPI0007B88682|nr:PREDICTED: THAP domain-containing protein 4-like isoform X4 [Sinocyclocheilus anshuiensis]